MIKSILATMALLAFSTTAFAGVEKGQMELAPVVGVAFPLGDFGDVATTGFTLGARLGYFISPQASVGASLIYNLFGVKDAFTIPGVDIEISTLEVTGDLKLLLGTGEKSSPFIRASMGAYPVEVKFSGGRASVSVSETDFGIGGGFGLQFKGEGNTGGFVEAGFTNIFSEGSSTSYATLRGGISFFMGGNSTP